MRLVGKFVSIESQGNFRLRCGVSFSMSESVEITRASL